MTFGDCEPAYRELLEVRRLCSLVADECRIMRRAGHQASARRAEGEGRPGGLSATARDMGFQGSTRKTLYTLSHAVLLTLCGRMSQTFGVSE
jgi:hypothetical protein